MKNLLIILLIIFAIQMVMEKRFTAYIDHRAQMHKLAKKFEENDDTVDHYWEHQKMFRDLISQQISIREGDLLITKNGKFWAVFQFDYGDLEKIWDCSKKWENYIGKAAFQDLMEMETGGRAGDFEFRWIDA